MTTVGYILRKKGNATIAISHSLPVREALTRMATNNVGSLLVVRGGQLVGLFTERDFARSVARRGESALGGTVGDVMVADVLYVSPDATIEECMALMTDKRTRHLPVLDGGEVVGIVSIGDVVKELIEDREFVIEQLERYITGR